MLIHARNPKRQVAEVAQVILKPAPPTLRSLTAPGVLKQVVQVQVSKEFATFTVHGDRQKTEDPNTAQPATPAISSMQRINRITTKG